MSERLSLGRRGEDVAMEYLLLRKMILIGRNVRFGHNEIDLVFMDGNFIRVVEVKSRIYPYVVPATRNVNWRKQQNLLRAVQKMLSKRCLEYNGKIFDLTDKEIVFDIVTVIFNGDLYKIKYIQNAFEPKW